MAKMYSEWLLNAGWKPCALHSFHFIKARIEEYLIISRKGMFDSLHLAGNRGSIDFSVELSNFYPSTDLSHNSLNKLNVIDFLMF